MRWLEMSHRREVVPMAVQDDVAAARAVVRSLERAVAELTRHYGDSLETRRLKADAGRLGEDLDLLCGRENDAAPAASTPLEVIADTDYSHDFWMDAEDEGLGRSDDRTR
jgi:hypothetical protein